MDNLQDIGLIALKLDGVKLPHDLYRQIHIDPRKLTIGIPLIHLRPEILEGKVEGGDGIRWLNEVRDGQSMGRALDLAFYLGGYIHSSDERPLKTRGDVEVEALRKENENYSPKSVGGLVCGLPEHVSCPIDQELISPYGLDNRSSEDETATTDLEKSVFVFSKIPTKVRSAIKEELDRKDYAKLFSVYDNYGDEDFAILVRLNGRYELFAPPIVKHVLGFEFPNRGIGVWDIVCQSKKIDEAITVLNERGYQPGRTVQTYYDGSGTHQQFTNSNGGIPAVLLSREVYFRELLHNALVPRER